MNICFIYNYDSRMINSYESSNKTKSVLTEVYSQKRGTCVTVVILGIIIGIFSFAYITFGNEPMSDTLAVNSTLKLVSIVSRYYFGLNSYFFVSS